MKKTVLVCLMLLNVLVICAENIPQNRLTNWTQAGLSDTIGYFDTILNAIDLGIVNDGSVNASPILQAAVTSYSNQLICIYFPTGTYLFESTVTLFSNTVIKGNGADSTHFHFDLGGNSGHCFQVVGSGNTPFVPVQSGLDRGSKVIKVNGASILQAGDYLEIKQQNGSWDSNPAVWATDVVGQIVKLEAKSGSNLLLDQEIRIDYDSLLNPQIRRIAVQSFVGLECFLIRRLDEAPGTSHNIVFSKSANCWVKGVESSRSNGSHIMITASTNIEVSDSYIHHAFEYSGSSTRGYGVTLAQHSGLCLIQNNIFKTLRHAMMVKEGANGNVFGYNYSRDPNRSEPISDFSGDISLHGHYPFANLFEGNIVQNIIIDHFWGPSGADNAFLRNATELYGLLMTTGTPNTEDQIFIGNDTYGFGFYAITGGGHIESGNRFMDSTQPVIDSMGELENSLYLSGAPDFWNLPTPWPFIGYPTNATQYTNPAKERWLSASDLASCCAVKDCSDQCNLPVDVKTVYKGGNKVLLKWRSGSVTALHEVRGRQKGTSEWIHFIYNCNPCSFPVSSLNPIAEYEWQVRTICGTTHSLWSAVSAFSIGSLQFCDTVAYLPETTSATSAQLAWRSVENANYYRLLGRQQGQTQIVELILPSSDTTFHATGLAVSTTYEYSVLAICDSLGFSSSEFTQGRSFTTSALKMEQVIHSDLHILSIEGRIVISNLQKQSQIEVFTIDGKKLYTKVSTDNSIMLPHFNSGPCILLIDGQFATILTQ